MTLQSGDATPPLAPLGRAADEVEAQRRRTMGSAAATTLGLLRAAVRLPLLVGSTGLLYTTWVVTRPLALVSRRLARRAHYAVTRAWGRASCAILGMSVEIRGPLPRAPFFLVSNHLSYVDIVLLLGCVDAYFLAKSEVASWPIMGWLASTTGTLFVKRAQKTDLLRVVPQVRERLEAGHGIIVFPEGTSTQGARVATFKPSLFEVAARTGTPVSTAAIHYATPPGARPAHLSVCWWGDMTFGPHCLRMLTLPSIRATLTFGTEPIAGVDRKLLAADAQRAVETLFDPVVGSETA